MLLKNYLKVEKFLLKNSFLNSFDNFLAQFFLEFFSLACVFYSLGSRKVLTILIIL